MERDQVLKYPTGPNKHSGDEHTQYVSPFSIGSLKKFFSQGIRLHLVPCQHFCTQNSLVSQLILCFWKLASFASSVLYKTFADLYGFFPATNEIQSLAVIFWKISSANSCVFQHEQLRNESNLFLSVFMVGFGNDVIEIKLA